MIDGLLRSLGLDPNAFRDGELAVHTPIDGSRLAAVRLEGRAAVAAKVERAEQAFRAWRQVPAPRRGELVRLFGEELRRHKAAPSPHWPARHCSSVPRGPSAAMRRRT